MKTIGIALAKLVIGLAICVLITKGLDVACEFTLAKASQVQSAVLDKLPKREVQKEPLDVQQAILFAAKTHGVDPLILKVISEKESAGGNPRSLYRFEPGLYSRVKETKSYRDLSDSEVRMLASSHGVFHILGITAERECNLHFSALYNVETSALCAARIVKGIDRNLQTTHTSQRLREIFKRYNGQGQAAEAYANDAMGRLAAILYQKING